MAQDLQIVGRRPLTAAPPPPAPPLQIVGRRPTAVPLEEPPTVPRRPLAAPLLRLRDIGVSALRGAVALPEAFVGLADLPTGGRVGQALERVGYRPAEARALLGRFYSPAQQEAFAAVDEATGLVDTAFAAVSHPSTIVQAAVESAPLMLGGAGIARGAMAAVPRLSALAAGAAGEGVLSAGSLAEQVRQDTGTLTPRQAALATAAGAGTGALALVGGQVARRFGFTDVDTMLARGAADPTARPALATAVVQGMIAEGLAEELPQSVQEQVLQNRAMGRPWDAGLDEAAVMGALAGAVMGGGAQVGALGVRGPAPASTPRIVARRPAAPAPAPAPAPAVSPVAPPPVRRTADAAVREAAGMPPHYEEAPPPPAPPPTPPPAGTDEGDTQAARNARHRAELAAAAPVTQDVTAMRAGRELERRVRAGVSPTGAERRVGRESRPPQPGPPNEFASTQVQLPESVAASIRTFAATIPDRVLAPGGREDDPHATVQFGLHGDDPAAVAALLRDEPPIRATLGRATVFQQAEQDVVVVALDSPDLERLHRKIQDALPVTETFPDYRPHATIAYVRKGQGDAYARAFGRRLEGQAIELPELVFSGKDRRHIAIPLQGSVEEGSRAAPAGIVEPRDLGERPPVDIRGVPPDAGRGDRLGPRAAPPEPGRPAPAEAAAQGPVVEDVRRQLASRDIPRVGRDVEALTVGAHVPNHASIEASFTEYEVLDGIRAVPMAAFEQQAPSWVDPREQRRTEALAQEIRRTGAIAPLIVVVDAETPTKGPYVLEGGHRFDALQLLGKQTVPALVVIDQTPERGAEAERVAAPAGPPREPTLELIEEPSGVEIGASGESAASLEAIRRGEGMRARAEQYVVYDRGGQRRPLLGPEAVDYQARPGETYGVDGPTGFRVLDDRGGRVPAAPRAPAPAPAPAEAQAITPAAIPAPLTAGPEGITVTPDALQEGDPRARRAVDAPREEPIPGGRRSPPRGRLSRRAEAERDVIERAVADAYARGYAGDEATLYRALNDRAALVRDIDAEVDASGGTPDALLREIANAGGLSRTAERTSLNVGAKGELDWLRQSSVGQRFGHRVLRDRGGLSLDGMVEYLQQDPRFQHIDSPNALLDELFDIAQGVKTNAGQMTADRLGAVGERWWETILAPADVLETGEAQPRLPDVGRVREQEVATPEVAEVPFALEAQPARRTPVQPTLGEPGEGPSGTSGAAAIGPFGTTGRPTPAVRPRPSPRLLGVSAQAVQRRDAAIRPVEFPELVELAQAVQQTPRLIRAFRKMEVRGQFRGPGGIVLRADLFRKGGTLTQTADGWSLVDPVTKATIQTFKTREEADVAQVERATHNAAELAKVLVHEMGHLADWLPTQTLKRGNLLGRLATLESFRKGTFTDANGWIVKDKALREELKAFSALWRPWDRSASKASYRQYRDSAKELYADALSGLFADPGLLERTAPTFYQTWFAEIDRKPDVQRAYFDLQELLSGTREELVAHRLAGDRRMFEEGDVTALEIQRRLEGERQARKRNLLFELKTELVDKNYAVIDSIENLKKQGVVVNPDADPRYLLSARNYVGGKIKGFLDRTFVPVYTAIDEAGIAWTDFGLTLLYERITHGDRSELANPRGMGGGNPEDVPQRYAALRQTYTPDQLKTLDAQVAAFRAAVGEVAAEAYTAGLYTDEMYTQMQENPAYATYRVIEHLDEAVTARIYQQVGTLKEVANAANSTILKTMATIRAIERNTMVRETLGLLEANKSALEAGAAPYSGFVLEDAETRWTGKRQTPVESRDRNKKLILSWQKGTIVGKYVDPYIAASLNNESVGSNLAAIRVLRTLNSGYFRPIFTTLNLGFQGFNAWRDFGRFYKALSQRNQNLSLGGAVKAYWRAVPFARVRAYGLKDRPSAKQLQAWDDLIASEEGKILSITFNDYVAGRTLEDTEIENLFSKSGIAPFQSERTSHTLLMRPIRPVLEWIKNTGDFIETLPKAAAIYHFTQGGRIEDLSRKDRAFIRERVGSPDFLAGGTWKPVTNELLLFSNAITQAWRSDLATATEPATRAGYWWKTAKVTLLPKLLMFAALVGLWPGDEEEGRDLQRLMQGASEYDRTNYIIVPLGRDATGNVVYFRLPQDDSGRLVGGLFWKALQLSRGETDSLRTVMDVVDYTAGQVPSVSPVFEGLSTTAQFLSGRNPYDAFRGRAVFTEDEWRARDWRTVKKFLGWEFQQLGGGIVWKFYPGESAPTRRTTGQKILDLPVVSNIVGRFLRVTNYGELEAMREASADVSREEARRRLNEREAVNAAIRLMVERPEGARPPSPGEVTTLAVRMAQDLYPDRREAADRRPYLQRKLRMGLSRGEADPLTDAVLGASSNAQRLAVLQRAKARMSAAEFAAWIQKARQSDVVSGALAADALRSEANAPSR